MKTIKPYLLIVLVFAFTSTFAQGPKRGASDGTQVATRSDEFQCLPNSVFSQVHPTFSDGFWADTGYGWSLIDDFNASGPFSSLRFWGGNFYGCGLGTSQTFFIKFYEPNISNPNQVGAMFWSGTLTATPLDMGLIAWGNTPLYQVDINLGTTLNLPAGWVSIQRQNPGDGCNFAGLVNYPAGGNAANYDGNYYLQNYGADMFFCLGGGAVTPVSPTAIILGIVLIGTAIVLRTRRYF